MKAHPLTLVEKNIGARTVRQPDIAPWRSCPHCTMTLVKNREGFYFCRRCVAVFDKTQLKSLHRKIEKAQRNA